MRRGWHLGAAALAAALFSAACGRPVDLTTALQLEGLSSGWIDAGVVEDGQNKLVPAVTFRLRNASTSKLAPVHVNALFRRVSEQHEWGNGFLVAAGSDGIAAGASTKRLTIASQHGYRGPELRYEMFENTLFVDAKVDLFVRAGSENWVWLADIAISRLMIDAPGYHPSGAD